MISGIIPLNTCYAIRCPTLDDAHAFATLLNAPLPAAWLGAIAEPARGGYRRYLGWTMALLPIPRNWPRARAILAPIGAQATAGSFPSDDVVHDAVLRAYGLPAHRIAPLLEWNAR